MSVNVFVALFPQYFKGTLGLQSGDSALFINGLHIDLDTQDIFRYELFKFFLT